MICGLVSAFTIAASPSEIDIDDAVRGGNYERSLKIFNPNGEAVTVDINVAGDAKDWVKIYDSQDQTDPISELYIPEKSSRVTVVVSVPDDALNGNYVNEIIISTKSTDSGSESQLGSSMKVQIKSLLNITVSGEEIISGIADYIKVGNSEVNYPVPVEVSFLNDGNVAIKPEISVSVLKDGQVIDSISYSDTEVKPEKKEFIIFNWDNSESLDPGTYAASVSVNLNGIIISQKDIEFELYPQGTFTREGDMTDLIYEGTPSTGKTIKVAGYFVNSGQIPTKAKLKGEIYRDGNFEEAFESDEYTIPVSKTEQLVYYINPQDPGSYRISACVVYEDKKTESKEIKFDVIKSESQNTQSAKNTTKTPLSPAIILGAVFAAAVLFVIKKKVF